MYDLPHSATRGNFFMSTAINIKSDLESLYNSIKIYYTHLCEVDQEMFHDNVSLIEAQIATKEDPNRITDIFKPIQFRVTAFLSEFNNLKSKVSLDPLASDQEIKNLSMQIMMQIQLILNRLNSMEEKYFPPAKIRAIIS